MDFLQFLINLVEYIIFEMVLNSFLLHFDAN